MKTVLLFCISLLAASLALAVDPFCATVYCTTVINEKGALVATAVAQKNIVAQNITDISNLITSKTTELAALLAKIQALNQTNTTTTSTTTTTTSGSQANTLFDVSEASVLSDTTTTTTTSTNEVQSIESINQITQMLQTFLGDLKIKVNNMIANETDPQIKLNLLSIYEQICKLESVLKTVQETLIAQAQNTAMVLSNDDSERAKQLQAQINALVAQQDALQAQYNKLVSFIEAAGADTVCTQILSNDPLICCIPGTVPRGSPYKKCSTTTPPLSVVCPEKTYLSTQLAAAQKSLTGYQADLAALDSSIADKNSGIASANTIITNTQPKIPAEQTRCADLQNTADFEIAKLKSEILVLQDLKVMVNNNTDISDKKTITDLIDTIIAGFMKDVSDRQNNLAVSKQQCSNNLAGFNADISAAQVQITTLTAAIASETVKKGLLNDLISQLNSQITSLNNQIAGLGTLCGN